MIKMKKKFRNKILNNDDKYYSSNGLFYKTLKHVLKSLIKSPLIINPKNTQTILKSHSYFKGFSDEDYYLFKKKYSPKLLDIYKFYFEKNFRIESFSQKNLLKNQKRDSSNNLVN